MIESTWILCPTCLSKTRTKVYKKTKLLNFPLYCPKCKQEKIINVDSYKLTIIKEPDARRRADN